MRFPRAWADGAHACGVLITAAMFFLFSSGYSAASAFFELARLPNARSRGSTKPGGASTLDWQLSLCPLVEREVQLSTVVLPTRSIDRSTTGSLVLLFEKELGFSNAEADTQFALWSGVCYVMPLFGGWIADRFLGELCTCWQAHQQAESKVHPRT